MNWIKLSIKSIVELFKYNKISLIIVMVGLVISGIGFQYFIGFSSGLYVKQISSMASLRTYPIEDTNNSNYYRIIDFLSRSDSTHYQIEDIVVKTCEFKTNNSTPRIIFRKSNIIYGIYASGSPFRKLENNQKKLSCIISRNLVDYSKRLNNIGIDFPVFNNIYKIEDIIDVTVDFDKGEYIILPFSQLKSCNVSIEQVNIITKNILTSQEFDKFKSDIATISPNVKITKNVEYEKEVMGDLSSSYNQRMILYLLLSAISVFNSLLLLNFWLENMKKEVMCYRLSGATNKTLFFIIYFELISLVILAEVVSIAVFEIIGRKVFRAIGIDLVLGIREYFVSFIFSVLSATFMLSIVISRLLFKINKSGYKI